MIDLSLSLRQRKLIHYLQQKNGNYTTGEELANHLHVSARTIRNDINELNQTLIDTGVQITSKRSSGYLLVAADEQDLKKLSQSSNSFYPEMNEYAILLFVSAFRMCLSICMIWKMKCISAAPLWNTIFIHCAGNISFPIRIFCSSATGTISVLKTMNENAGLF